jgi:hypothetical protein
MTNLPPLQSRQPAMHISRLQSVAITAWVVLVTSADLKQIVPYVHWYGTIALVLLTGTALSRALWSGMRFCFVTGSLLVLAIGAAGLGSADPVYELLEAGKLGVILLVVLPLLTSGLPATAAAFRGVRIAVYVNVVLAFAGALGYGALGGLMAPGRFGTILNTPGSLWRVGVLALAGSVLRFSSGRAKPRDLPLLLGSLVLLLLDGSRTAFVILTCGGAALVIALVRRSVSRAGRGRPLAIMAAVACLAPMLLVLSAGSGMFFESGEVGLVRRGLTVVQAIVTGNSDDIDRVDSARSQMNRDVIAAIADHPVLGNGMGTTRSAATAGPVVIHNAYLQMWADVGLLGFLSFSALTLGSIPVLCARYRRRAGADPERRVLFYNGMFLLACWGVAALLHPVSTELSEWIMFILGYSSVVVAGTAPALRPMPYRADGRTLLHRGCLA